MKLSLLTTGRILFISGIVFDVIYWVYTDYYLKSINPWTPWIYLAGGLFALSGLYVLCSKPSIEDAEKRYREQEQQEQIKQKKRTAAEFERMRAGGWSDWDEYTQIRRPQERVIEFRNSKPIATVTALLLFLAAADVIFLGILFPHFGSQTGISIAFIGIVILFIISGTEINGLKLEITRWWGWYTKPIIHYQLYLSTIESFVIDKKYGPKSGSYHVGRSVRYPLYLLTKSSGRILLKSCTDISEARSLCKEISKLVNIPFHDYSGDAQTRIKKELLKEAATGESLSRNLNPKELQNYLRQHIVDIAEWEFPDNKGLDWIIHGFEQKDEFNYVEVEPVPPEVGYDRFKFAITTGNSGAIHVAGIYYLDGDGYTLLSYKPGYKGRLQKRLV